MVQVPGLGPPGDWPAIAFIRRSPFSRAIVVCSIEFVEIDFRPVVSVKPGGVRAKGVARWRLARWPPHSGPSCPRAGRRPARRWDSRRSSASCRRACGCADRPRARRSGIPGADRSPDGLEHEDASDRAAAVRPRRRCRPTGSGHTFGLMMDCGVVVKTMVFGCHGLYSTGAPQVQLIAWVEYNPWHSDPSQEIRCSESPPRNLS